MSGGDQSPSGASRRLQPYFSDTTAPSSASDALLPLEQHPHASSARRPHKSSTHASSTGGTPLKSSTKKNSHPPRAHPNGSSVAPAWFDDQQAAAWMHPEEAALSILDEPLEPSTPQQSRRRVAADSTTTTATKKKSRGGKKVKKQQVTVASANQASGNYNDLRWQEDEEFKDVLDDLSSRFILNLPAEELELPERVCFQVEQAHWFYEDFIREDIPRLPSFTLRRFSSIFFRHCPLLSQWSDDHEQAFERFMQYKIRVPVCGAIMLNERWDRCVLVKGWKSSASWGFPKGKINREELKPDCAVREVLEETGFDCSDLLDPEDFIEFEMNDQRMTLYIVTDVPEDTVFQTQTRKEISAIEWFKLTDLPTWKKSKNHHGPGSNGSKKYRFYMLAPFVAPLKQWIKLNKDLVMDDSGREEANTATPVIEPAQPAATTAAAVSEIDELFKRFLGSDARPSTPKTTNANANVAATPATPDPSMQMLLQKLSTASPRASPAPTKAVDLLSMLGNGNGNRNGNGSSSSSPRPDPARPAASGANLVDHTKQEKQQALLSGLMASIASPSQGATPSRAPNDLLTQLPPPPPLFHQGPRHPPQHQLPMHHQGPATPQHHQQPGLGPHAMQILPMMAPNGAPPPPPAFSGGGMPYPLPPHHPNFGQHPPQYLSGHPPPPPPAMVVSHPTHQQQPPAHPLLASLSPVAPRAVMQQPPTSMMSQSPHKAPSQQQATNASQLLSMLGGGR